MTAQPSTEAPRALPRNTGLPGLYTGAVAHLAARLAATLSRTAGRLHQWATTAACAPDDPTARNRAVAARHPSARPYLTAVPTPPGDPQ